MGTFAKQVGIADRFGPLPRIIDIRVRLQYHLDHSGTSTLTCNLKVFVVTAADYSLPSRDSTSILT